eukprot:Skav232861  [mRNA]  locus=scaffold2451:157983:160619:+ [translate_table: standard]
MENEPIAVDDESDGPSLPSPVDTEPDHDHARQPPGPGSENEGSDVSLPDSVNSATLGETQSSCCKKKCHDLFSNEDKEAFKLAMQQGENNADIQNRKFECVKTMFRQNGAEEQKKGLHWFFKGHRVCRRFWEQMHSLTPSKVDKWLKLCRNGQVVLPKAGPRAPKPEPTMDRVGLWFLECYQHLAEPLALEGSEDRMPVGMQQQQHEIVDDVSHPLYSLSFLAGAGTQDNKRLAGKRFVNMSSWLDFYRFYQADVPVELCVSRSTFDRCYNRSWCKYLILRSPSTGNKCTICLRLDEERSNASTDQERLQVDLEKQQHLDTTKRDRAVNTRGNIKGSDLSNFKPGIRHQGFLKIMLDGMDQQKFAFPRARRLQGTSEYGKAWKANVHVVGCILWGIAELYFLLPMDIAKDSSMECTLLARALDLAKTYLKAMDDSFDIPDHLVVAIDSTPREGKNQVFACFLGALTARMFSSVECQFMQISHTHNELDQRFSTMASVVKRAESLQSLEDLKNHLSQRMTPSAGRAMHIEIVSNTCNFKDWLKASVECEIKGLTSTKHQGANHLWRFCRRELIAQERIECQHAKWQDLPEDPNDICVTFKQFISDTDKSQDPMLLMPVHVWQSLKKDALQPSHRNPLGPTTVAEFRKTAKFVGSHPWLLLEAQAWLEKFCDENESGKIDSPPDLQWVFSKENEDGHRVVQAEAPLLDEVALPNTEAPRPVNVKASKSKAKAKCAAKAKASLKRPASVLKRPAADSSQAPEPLLKRPAAAGTESEVVANDDGGMDADHAESLPGPDGAPAAESSPVPAASSGVSKATVADAVEAITSLPNFLHFGCSKCRKKQTPKIGCAQCREKADKNIDGYRKSTQGWIYQLQVPDVD